MSSCLHVDFISDQSGETVEEGTSYCEHCVVQQQTHGCAGAVRVLFTRSGLMYAIIMTHAAEAHDARSGSLSSQCKMIVFLEAIEDA